MPSFRATLGYLLTAALAWACGDDAPTSNARALDDREFLLESSQGFEPVANTTVRVSFTEDEFGFSAGCNGHFGMFSLSAGSLPSGSQLCLEGLGSTDIGCEPALADQDDALAAFFSGKPTLELDGDRLTLSDAEVTLVFLDREVADPDRSLTGRTWSIDTFIQGGAATGGGLEVEPTLSFEADGTLQVFTTCNTGQGNFVVDAQTLTLSSVAYTEEPCGSTGSENAQLSIQAVLMDGQVDFQIEAARLSLMRGDRGLSATTE